MNEDSKRGWTSLMLDYAGEGQELDLPDKILIRKQVEKFVDDYTKAQGEPPEYFFSNVRICYNYIRPFGFSMPKVDKWIESDIRDIQGFSERLRILKNIYPGMPSSYFF